MNFSEALEQLKQGKTVTRAGWKHKGVIWYANGYKGRYSPLSEVNVTIPYGEAGITPEEGIVRTLPLEDLLASDWIVLETPRVSPTGELSPTYKATGEMIETRQKLITAEERNTRLREELNNARKTIKAHQEAIERLAKRAGPITHRIESGRETVRSSKYPDTHHITLENENAIFTLQEPCHSNDYREGDTIEVGEPNGNATHWLITAIIGYSMNPRAIVLNVKYKGGTIKT